MFNLIMHLHMKYTMRCLYTLNTAKVLEPSNKCPVWTQEKGYCVIPLT